MTTLTKVVEPFIDMKHFEDYAEGWAWGMYHSGPMLSVDEQAAMDAFYRDCYGIDTTPKQADICAALCSTEIEVCRVIGHDVVDCSTAGPDSGNMDHQCVRCGRYWSVPLY